MMLAAGLAESRLSVLRTLQSHHARIAIVGGPRTGKSTLAGLVEDRPVIRTDNFRHIEWSQVPAAIIERCKGLERFIIEGVQAARALRSGLVVDAVIYLDSAACERTDNHRNMAKGIESIFREWRDRNRLVHVVSPDLPQA